MTGAIPQAARGSGPQGRRAPAHIPGGLISLEDAAVERLSLSLPLRCGVHTSKQGQPRVLWPPSQRAGSSLGKEGFPEEPTPALEPKGQQRQTAGGRKGMRLGDGDGPTQLDPRVDLGREASVASSPGWKPGASVRKPQPTSKCVGRGEGGARAL